MFTFLGRVIGIIFRFLRATLPYAWKVVVFVDKAMAVTLIATFRGWIPVAKKLADESTDEILSRFLLPSRYAKAINIFFLTIAFFTMAIGWICLSYLTVFLVRWIF